MSVEHVWAGASSDVSFWVRAKVTGSSTRLAVSESDDLSSPVFFGGPETPTADGMVSITASGLTAGTRYYYGLEDDAVLDTTFVGTVLTHPAAAGERANYVFGAAGDAGLTGAGDDSYITSAVSDNPVFDTMRAQALAEDWVWFSHLGDLHYRNIATADTALYRSAYDDNATFNGTLGADARQGHFLRSAAVTYAWDDHDFGLNNSDRTHVGNANANAVYRERVPHYTLGADGIYQSWQVGRVLYIASDVRTFRDPNSDPQGPSKTMLGSAQKAWIEGLLTADSGAEALVWITPSRWIGGSDTWSSFLHERDEMVQLFGDLRWIDRMILMTADEHALAISSGPNNRYGNFPMFMFASMDSSYSTGTDDNDPTYNIGRKGGRQQYGTMRVQDNGHTIALTGTGYINGAVWNSHTKYVNVGNPVLALNYAAHLVPPLDNTDDDQFVVNQVTAQREGGGEVTIVKETGALSVQDPPDGAGPYPPEQVTVQVPTDDALPSQAGWRVYLGTVDEPRYPAISLDLGRNPELIDAVATQDIGDALTVAGTPSWLPPDGIGQHIDGYTETLNGELWDWQANGAPGSPWGSIAQLPPGDEATAQPDQPNRLDTSGSQLTDAASGPALNPNPDAETTISDWFGFNAALDRVATPGSPPFAGSWSVEVTPDGSGTASANAPASAAGSITPDEEYLVSCWVYSPGGWADMKPAVDWIDSSGGYLSTGGLATVTAVPAGEWTFLTQVVVAPAGADRGAPRSLADSSPSPGDVWYTDELTLRKGATVPAELLVHTPQDGVHDRAVWLNAMRVFNDNWDFEESLDGWVGNGATIARVATPAPAPFPGSWSLQLTPDGIAEFPNAGSDQFAVVPGESYTVSGWLRCDTARGVDLNINWFDAAHNYLSTGSNGISVAADTWAFIEGTFTAPAAAAFANMAPTMGGFPPSADVLYGDILTIRPAGPANSMPAQLPYDLTLGGEVVRATSVEPLVWDEFGRTETNTWGTSSSGHAYTETSGAASDRAVSGGSGTITLASTPEEIRFQRAAETVTDAELHVTLAVDQTATGQPIIPGVMFRWTGTFDFYRARLHFNTDGTMATSVTRGTTQIGSSKSLVFSYTPGEIFHLRARLIGHRILIRSWPDSQAEPVVWHNDETVTEALGLIESGAVGMTASAFLGNTNVNPVISYDEFQVVTPQRATVERSLNGVTKTHAAGAAVSLARPAVLGL